MIEMFKKLEQELLASLPVKQSYPFMASPDENLCAAEVKGYNKAIAICRQAIAEVFARVGVDEQKILDELLSSAVPLSPNPESTPIIFCEDFRKIASALASSKDLIRVKGKE